MYKIGFSLQPQYSCPISQVIPLLKDADFTAVSPVWTPELDLACIAGCVNDNGMMIQSLHAPHKGIPLLWKPDAEESLDICNNIIRSIDDCAKFGIPVLVIHGWQGLIYTFPNSPLDFRHFDKIVLHAQKQGVSIAFENLEGEEYLAALLTRYVDQSHVGYCWDSGHDHCYPHKTDFLSAYGERLIMTHLNDNLGLRDPSGIPSGNDDLHFLPYDGKIDWNRAIAKLKTAAPQKILNFEIKTKTHSTDPRDLPYGQMPLDAFFRKAGEHARKIAELYYKNGTE